MNELRDGRGELGDSDVAARLEWRVTNGIGGFAAGTASGELAHRRHGLLFAALASPDSPTLLLARLGASLEIGGQSFALDTSAWSSGAIDPAGHRHLESLRLEDGVPMWVWAIGGIRLELRVWMERGENTTYVQYRLRSAPSAARLHLLALVNHRPAHRTLSHGIWTARVEPATGGLRIEAFDGATPLWLLAPGAEIHPRHDWHREHRLRHDRSSGVPAREDHLLAAEIVAALEPGEDFTLVASTRKDAGAGEAGPLALVSALTRRHAHERALLESWRGAHPAIARHAPGWIRTLVLMADGYLDEWPAGVGRGCPGLAADTGTTGEAVLDTLVALPGLTLATGRPGIGREILEQFAEWLEDGLLPRSRPESGGARQPGSAVATLWYVQAARAYFEHTLDTAFLARLYPRLDAALEALARGTHGGVSADPSDGLLRAGVDAAPATWMDARLLAAGLAPRHGKAVETNALWYNAHTAMLGFARRLRRSAERWETRASRLAQAFGRFWNAEQRCLYDVLDGPYGADASIRPNQILALSLPESPLAAGHRRSVLLRCAHDLLTSHGLRSLSPEDPRYLGRESGDAVQDARAAVLGSAWTWLLPHYALAHQRLGGDRAPALELLEPLEALMRGRGLGLMPERSDGGPPHAPRGAANRAWPVAEILRAYHLLSGGRRDLRRREMTRARDAAEAAPRRALRVGGPA